MLLPYDINLSGVFSTRSTMPFSVTAGIDVNGDANVTDYVPGTTRNVFNRGQDTEMMAAGIRGRAREGAALQPPRIDTNEIFNLDMASRGVRPGRQRVEAISRCSTC